MRIGIDLRVLQFHSAWQGMGYYARGLVASLIERGGDNSFLLIFADGDLPPLEFIPGLEQRHNVRVERISNGGAGWVRRMPEMPLLWRYGPIAHRYVDARALTAAVRRLKLDVLHLTALFEPGFHAYGSFDCASVATIYDLIPFLDISPRENIARAPDDVKYQFRAQLEFVHEIDSLVAISESTARDLEAMCPETEGKIRVIYPGVTSNFLSPGPAGGRLPRGLAGPYFLFSGRGARKNLPVAIKALALGFADRPEVQLLVKGQIAGPDADLIARCCAEAGLDRDRIVCPGFVSDADLPALYANAVALVFPSRYEGFGLPVVEAMTCGCPVITANNSSLTEVAEGHALLVADADNASELAAAMQRVFNDEQLASDLRAKGRLRAAHFSWARAADQHLALYGELARAPRPHVRESSYGPLWADVRKASASFVNDRRTSAGQSPNRRRM